MNRYLDMFRTLNANFPKMKIFFNIIMEDLYGSVVEQYNYVIQKKNPLNCA